jgi:hypothetical protein
VLKRVTTSRPKGQTLNMQLMSPADALGLLNLTEGVTPDEIKEAYRIMVVGPLSPGYTLATCSPRFRL